MKEIPLTKGKFAIVDDEDYESLSQHKWQVDKDGYACRNSKVSEGKKRCIRMHRVVNKTPDGILTDHINGIKFDNQKHNLRNCTFSQNRMNCGFEIRNTSGIRGVCFDKKSGKFMAQIQVNYVKYHIGRYPTKEEAHVAFVEAAKRLNGEFAHV